MKLPSKGYLSGVELLLNRRADLTLKDDKGNTAEDLAREAKFDTVAFSLIKRRLGIDASESPKQALEKILLSALDPDESSSLKWWVQFHASDNNALLFLFRCAILYKQFEIVERLLEANIVDINASFGKEKWSALHHGVSFASSEWVSYLVAKGANVNQQDFERATPLHHALSPKIIDKKIIAAITAAGADIGAKRLDGITPLDLAWEQDIEILNILLSNAPAAKEAIDSTCLLHRAIRDEKYSLAKDLVNLGADLKKIDSSLVTPLHLAVTKGSIPFCHFLILRESNVNQKDAKGATPLHYALLEQEINKELIAFLIRSGADVFAEDNEGLTPIDVAMQKGDRETLSLLLPDDLLFSKEVIDKRCLLHRAIFYKMHSLAEELIKHGANVNHRDKMGATPLHLAAQNRSISFCQALTNLGADLNATDARGATPLHYALSRQETDPEMIVFLVNSGASIHAKTDDEITPL